VCVEDLTARSPASFRSVADGNLNDLPEISPRTCAMKSQVMVNPSRKALQFANEEVGEKSGAG
jgi:hypothetical protein